MAGPVLSEQPQLSEVGQLDKAFESLRAERVPFEDRWRDCADHVLPSRPAFLLREAKGTRSNHKIMDTTATQSLRIATSGLLNGMASPSRPWFQLTTADPAVAERPEVKRWLEDVRDAVLGIMERANYYQETGKQLSDDVLFGTSQKMIFEAEDPARVIRCETLPVGSFWLGQDASGTVSIVGREFKMNVRQAADEFGLERLSLGAQEAYRSGRPEHDLLVRHLIEPNPEYRRGSMLPRFMRYRERYWETAGSHSHSQSPTWGGHPGTSMSDLEPLRRGGFHEFPGSCARWGRNHSDVYATDWPVLDVLGDIKQLQAMERVGLNALNKNVNPPLKGGPGVDASAVSQLAGAVTIESTPGDTSLEPIHVPNINLQQLEAKTDQLRMRIRRGLMEDIFLMLLGDSRGQPPTAEEVRQRVREKLAVLGPVLEIHADDVLDRDIERIVGIAIRRSRPMWAAGRDGLLPRPPRSLQSDVRVTYVSEIAQAQKLVGVGALERHLAFVAGQAEIHGAVVDVVNYDEAVRRHAEMLGLPHEVTATEDEVEERRAAAAEAQRQAEMAEQAPKLAKAAVDMASLPPAESALDEALG